MRLGPEFTFQLWHLITCFLLCKTSWFLSSCIAHVVKLSNLSFAFSKEFKIFAKNKQKLQEVVQKAFMHMKQWDQKWILMSTEIKTTLNLIKNWDLAKHLLSSNTHLISSINEMIKITTLNWSSMVQLSFKDIIIFINL